MALGNLESDLSPVVRFNTRFVLGALLLLLLPLDLQGQRIGASAGPAFPRGSLAESRSLGFRAAGFTATGNDLLRIEVSYVHLPGSDSIVNSESRGDSWRTLSFGVNLRPSFVTSPPYRILGVVGLAAHRTTVPGRHNPYGTSAGLQLGLAIERALGPLHGFAETGIHVVLSDFGVSEFTPASYIPLVFGVSWSPAR